MRMSAFGLEVDMPASWDGRLYRRAPDPGEQTLPILHAATFPLPADRGDYGSGAVDIMGSDDVLVVLTEFDPDDAGRGLFRHQGVPRLQPGDFRHNRLQRPLRGQSGAQHFFSQHGRAFCLYVVLGSHARRVPLTRKANQLVERLGVR